MRFFCGFAREGLCVILTLCVLWCWKCAGSAGGISHACGKRNIRCGPVIEIKNGLDFLDEALFIWLIRLSLSGRIWLAVLEPPCTTFSLARHPALRTSYFPENGNTFALLCLLLALTQWAGGNEFLTEQLGFWAHAIRGLVVAYFILGYGMGLHAPVRIHYCGPCISQRHHFGLLFSLPFLGSTIQALYV